MKMSANEKISGLLSQAIEDGVMAGASVLIRKDGEELFFDVQGMADRERGIPLRRDHIFRLYSMSKPITSAAAMLLLERGELDFAQPVAEILPEFGNASVIRNGKKAPAEAPVTVFELLNMTSGLTYGGCQSETERRTEEWISTCVERLHSGNPVTTREFARGLADIPLAFEPGTSWQYGTSADVLGAVIEEVSGMPFGAFLEKNIFEPLGMKDTGFYVPASKQERLACSYESDGKGGMKLYTGDNLAVSNRMDVPPAFEAGGAGLVSTIDDYARFAQMLLNGGSLDGVRILEPETVRYMTAGGLEDSAQISAFHRWVGLEGFTYGFLMRRLLNAGSAALLGSPGEYGWDGWLGCYFANLPRENATVLVMMQRKDAGTLSVVRRIRNVAGQLLRQPS